MRRVLDDADRTYSRFRADSELSRAHHTPTGVVVSPLLAAALDAAFRGALLSDGLVDPTVGRSLRLAGYDVDFAHLPPVGEPIVLRAERVPGWQSIEWDPGDRRLRVPRGIELDLGSTGKALASDLGAAAALGELPAGAGVLVSVGGDMTTAGAAPDGGWRVLVAEDSTTPPDAGGEVIAISDGAVATSSTTVRRWQRGDLVLHHLIDPRSGRPASGPWRTVSVIAATCVDANIAATGAIVAGDDALEWLAATGLPARLVAIDGRVERIGGWPVPETAGAEA